MGKSKSDLYKTNNYCFHSCNRKKYFHSVKFHSTNSSTSLNGTFHLSLQANKKKSCLFVLIRPSLILGIQFFLLHDFMYISVWFAIDIHVKERGGGEEKRLTTQLLKQSQLLFWPFGFCCCSTALINTNHLYTKIHKTCQTDVITT